MKLLLRIWHLLDQYHPSIEPELDGGYVCTCGKKFEKRSAVIARCVARASRLRNW